MNLVLNWKTAENLVVRFGTLSPFLPLLNCSESPTAQLYAIWTLRYFCTKNREKILYKLNYFQKIYQLIFIQKLKSIV
jgi:hypothetical protein